MSSTKFQRLKFPIHEVKGDLLKAFPELSRYDAFADYDGKDRDKWIKYVIYLYDKNSELIREYELLSDRKIKAMELSALKPDDELPKLILSAAFKDEDGEYRPEVLKVYGMIFTYLTRVMHNHKWMELCTLEAEYDEYMRRRHEKIDTQGDEKKELEALAKKSKLRQDCQEIIELITSYKAQIFGDDENAEYFKNIEKIATPENVARGRV